MVNPATNLFCQACGSRLATATVAAAPVPPPAAPYPPQQGGYPPPPAYPPQQALYGQPPALGYQAPAPVFVAPAIDKLGVKVDEFSDIVPDLGERAAKVEETFVNALKEKGLPGVNVFKSIYTAGGKQRAYVGVTNPAGATILVDFVPVGKDLASNWSLYTKRAINWLTVGIVGGAAIFFALLTFVFGLIGLWGFSSAWSQFFNTLSLLLIAGILVAGLLGKILKDDVSAFFVKDMDDIAWEDTNVLQSVVHDTMIDAIETVQAEPASAPAEEKKEKKGK
jgi:hypothetical protein